MHMPHQRFSRRTAVRGALVALSLVGGGLTTQLVASGVAHADTPTICDSLPHVQLGDLSGVWGNDGEVVTLTQVGSSVTGIAAYTEGGTATYTGCFDGATFYLSYTNAVDAGYGQLTLSADGTTLQGYWSSAEDSSGPHSWTLQRLRS